MITLYFMLNLEPLFRVMDKNRDGFINKMEVMEESSPHLTINQVDALFCRNDWKLYKEEFKDTICRNSRDQKMLRFYSTESVKSLPGSPQQDQARSNTESLPNTGESCRRTTRSSSASAGRRQSESPVQNAPRWRWFSWTNPSFDKTELQMLLYPIHPCGKTNGNMKITHGRLKVVICSFAPLHIFQ